MNSVTKAIMTPITPPTTAMIPPASLSRSDAVLDLQVSVRRNVHCYGLEGVSTDDPCRYTQEFSYIVKPNRGTASVAGCAAVDGHHAHCGWIRPPCLQFALAHVIVAGHSNL